MVQDSSPKLGGALDGDGQRITNLADPTNPQDAATKAYLEAFSPNWMMRGRMDGLRLSNNTSDTNNDIDIAAGVTWASNSDTGMQLTSGMTKRLDDSWAIGSGNGGLFSGVKANNTWYHVFLIRKSADGSIDAGFDTNITAANIPSGYSAYRRLGSVKTDGSGNILGFVDDGYIVEWKVEITDLSTRLCLKTGLSRRDRLL